LFPELKTATTRSPPINENKDGRKYGGTRSTAIKQKTPGLPKARAGAHLGARQPKILKGETKLQGEFFHQIKTTNTSARTRIPGRGTSFPSPISQRLGSRIIILVPFSSHHVTRFAVIESHKHKIPSPCRRIFSRDLHFWISATGWTSVGHLFFWVYLFTWAPGQISRRASGQNIWMPQKKFIAFCWCLGKFLRFWWLRSNRPHRISRNCCSSRLLLLLWSG